MYYVCPQCGPTDDETSWEHGQSSHTYQSSFLLTLPKEMTPMKIKIVRTLKIEYNDDDLSLLLTALGELVDVGGPNAERAGAMRRVIIAALDGR